MNHRFAVTVVSAMFAATEARAGAQAQTVSGPKVWQPAPLFSAVDTHGVPRELSSLRGKWVVLEWFSHACPYTGKHYGSGNMQKLQREYTAKGVTWLSIVSSAPGKEGYTSVAEANRLTDEKKAAPTAVIRDTSGVLGHLYGARNTPQLFVIDPHGVLRYAGAIDDKPTTKIEDIATANNYLRAALDAAMAGKPVAQAVTQPYGCTVQY